MLLSLFAIWMHQKQQNVECRMANWFQLTEQNLIEMKRKRFGASVSKNGSKREGEAQQVKYHANC